MNDIKTDSVWLMKGDCLERMKEIESGSVDLILTDPPYGTTACKWDSVIPLEPMWEQLKRIIKTNGAIVLFGSQPFTSVLVTSNLKMFKYEWVWQKSHATGHLNSKKQPMRQHENICVFYKQQCKYFPQMVRKSYLDKRTTSGQVEKVEAYSTFTKVQRQIDITEGYPKTVQYFATPFKGGEGGKHPTQKPVSLMEYLIKTYTNENETVLDFTFGSGTTAIASLNTKRSFIGIEKDEHYFQVGKDRVEKHLQTLDYTPKIVYS